jgi:hypothetical protein
MIWRKTPSVATRQLLQRGSIWALQILPLWGRWPEGPEGVRA